MEQRFRMNRANQEKKPSPILETLLQIDNQPEQTQVLDGRTLKSFRLHLHRVVFLLS